MLYTNKLIILKQKYTVTYYNVWDTVSIITKRILLDKFVFLDFYWDIKKKIVNSL